MKTTIYVLAKKSTLWKTGYDYEFDLTIKKVAYWFNDILLQQGWVDLNTVLSSLGFPKEIDKVALGWKLDYMFDFNNHGIGIEIVAKDDDEYIAFHNIVNLLEEVRNDENQ